MSVMHLRQLLSRSLRPTEIDLVLDSLTPEELAAIENLLADLEDDE